MDDYREASIEMTHKFLYCTSIGSMVVALKLIYRRLYIYKWNKSVPAPVTLNDFDVLYAVNDEYILFHRTHRKFGSNIVEFGDSSLRNYYCFFDYSVLFDLFNWFDASGRSDAAPPTQTYYALPSDRHFYEKERHFYQDLDID